MKNEVDEDVIREAIDVLREINSVDTSAGYERIAHSIRMKKRNRRMKLYARIGGVACVVVAVAAMFWYAASVNDTGIPIVTEILPGEKQARLILADGREIAIGGSSHEGVTIDEGNTMITSEEGVLRYHRKGEEHGGATTAKTNRLHTPKGGEFDIILDDGTHVWLNSDTRLSYPSVFTGNERRIFLEGEAYFEVAKNADKPFIVETADQTLTVLGTEFNIYAYAEESKVVTTLIEGSVSVSINGGEGGTYILTPGQQSALTTGGNYVINHVDVADVIAWKNGFFAFDELSLEQAMIKLARWYNVEVRYQSEETKRIVFKGNLPRYENLRSLLNIFEKSSPARFMIQDHTVTITM